jgi:hypothetical protein
MRGMITYLIGPTCITTMIDVRTSGGAFPRVARGSGVRPLTRRKTITVSTSAILCGEAVGTGSPGAVNRNSSPSSRGTSASPLKSHPHSVRARGYAIR